MRQLIIPPRLKRGDKIAAVSLSWGGAGDKDILWRYELGVKRLRDVFGLDVVQMENTLKGSAYIRQNPAKRAEDLMAAFRDPEIKGIFSTIGGDDSICMLPYIDFDVIRENPKVLLGYSDTTISHFICWKAGVRSYYGPSILAEFAENIEIFDYTVRSVQKALFSDEVIGRVEMPDAWTSEYLPWIEENRWKRKAMHRYTPFVCLQGKGTVSGHLIGGCVEVLDMMKGTTLWNLQDFDNAVLFLETSEEMPSPDWLRFSLRNLGAQGLLQQLSGIVFALPYENRYAGEYKTEILSVLEEWNLRDLPVLFGLPFGHTEPMIVIPYGAVATISCDDAALSIDEAACN